MSITSSKIYYINTENKVSGTNSRFAYKIPIPVGSQFDRCVVLQASVPVSFYLIQDGFNSFILTEIVKGVTHTQVITVAPGNYTSTSFAVLLSSILTKASGFGYSYNVVYQKAQIKYLYYVNNNPGDQISFQFNSHLSQQCGFNKISTINFPMLGNDAVLSTNLLDFSTESTIYIHSDMTNE